MQQIYLTDKSFAYMDQLANPHQETVQRDLLAALVLSAFGALPPEDTQPLESSTDETP